MATDWNAAAREKLLRDSPTDLDCYRQGATHRAYGWARSPWGHWTARQIELYNQGFDGKPFNPPQ